MTIGHALSISLESLLVRSQGGDPAVTAATLRGMIHDLAACYNPEMPQDQDSYELRSLSAPVFNSDGQVAFALGIWGPLGTIGLPTVEEYARRLLATAASATAAIGGEPAKA